MIIKIDRQQLIEPLKYIVGVSEKKQTMPILGNVLIRGDGDGLILVASDLEVEMSAKIAYPASNDINTTMPTRKFLDILKSLPGKDEVSIDIGDNKATIKSGKSKFVLATLPGDDFPYEPTAISCDHKVSANELDTLIGHTSFSMAVQDARHFLNGLFFEVKSDTVTVVSTDGHRLSLSAACQDNDLDEPITCIIPRKCIIEIKRILSSFKDNKDHLAEFSLKKGEIIFKISDFIIKSKLIEGNYPDYNKVFPESLPHKLSVDKEDLKSALQRMSILSNEQFKGVKLSLTETEIMISTNNPSQEEGEDSVPCQYTGEELEIGFNLTYLLEAIDVIASDKVTFQLNNADSGCLISSDSNDPQNKYIIMPMRV